MLPSDGVWTQFLRLSDHLAGDRAVPDLQHRAAGSGGLDANYEFLIRDERLIGSLAFTLIYTFVRVALEVVLGLMLALLLMRNLRGRWLSNFIMLLPWVMAPLLAATV